MIFENKITKAEIKKQVFTGNIIKKDGQATHIAPLQPLTLASFQTWGDSAGAGRMRLARGHKSNTLFFLFKHLLKKISFLL
jgi:hypothetical protein